MSWLDVALLSASPLLVVMSVVALALPAARPVRPIAGVSLAWLIAFAAGTVVALMNLDRWRLDCTIGVFRTGVTGGMAVGGHEPCAGSNNLPLSLVALPAALGIAVLLAWVWRHTTPAAVALRTSAVLVGVGLAGVALGRLNGNLALLLIVGLVAASYAWPWLRDRVGPLRPTAPGAS
jgi:hypothetical protein